MIRWLTLCLGLALVSPAGAGMFNVFPIRVELPSGQRAETVQVVSAHKKAMILKAQLMRWRKVEGKDELTPTSELAVTPAVFRLDSGSKQVLRIGFLGRPVPLPEEKAYRLVVQEIPGAIQEASAPDAPAEPEPTGIKIVLETALVIDLPVFVLPKKPQKALAASLKVSQEGARLEVANTGNINQKLIGLSLRTDKGRTVELKDKSLVTLAGHTSHLSLGDALPVGERAVALLYTEDYRQGEVVISTP